MGQPRRLSISEFSERDRLQANKALRLELKNRPHLEVANCYTPLKYHYSGRNFHSFFLPHSFKFTFFYYLVHLIKGSFIDCT